SRRRHTRWPRDWSSDVCSSDLAAETDKLDGLAVNIGSGHGTPIREIAERLSDILKIDNAPEINGEFRPGEMRHLTSDTTLARSEIGRASCRERAYVMEGGGALR